MKHKTEISLSVLLTAAVLGLYYYFFGVADRKIVFLYEHLGFQPFDPITCGRYWMLGLVLSGFISILYLLLQCGRRFLLKSALLNRYAVLQYAWAPVTAGILLIMMSQGEPVMPFSIALSSALALTLGTALGFNVVDDLLTDFRGTLAYLACALGTVPFLVLFRTLELPQRGILTMSLAGTAVLVAFLGGLIWLLLCYRVFRSKRPAAVQVIKGSFAITYIGLPLLHYVISTPKGIPYITSSENFFPEHLLLRLLNWGLLVWLVWLGGKTAQLFRSPGK